MQMRNVTGLVVSASLIGLGLTGAAAAATPRQAAIHAHAICAKSFDPYSVPRSVARSCGDRIMPLLHVTPLPGGGRSYDYGSYTWLEPPAHFNVLKASDKRLSEYRLPSRKQLGRQWYGIMRHFRHFITPPAYLLQVPSAMNFQCTTTQSCNWDGHYVSGHTYDEVTGTWTEPHFKAAGCSGDEFSQWAGLGGISSKGSLGQTGTAFNESGLAAHQGFIETIIDFSNTPPTAINGFVPSAGDTVYASVLWSSPHYIYLLNDQTTGASSGSILSRTDNDPDNSTAEFISERPTVGGSLTQLSDFQSVTVKNATSYWSGNSAGFVNNPQHSSIQMYDTSGTQIASTTNLTSSSDFTNTWEHCH